MLKRNFTKRWAIKICRYVFRQQFLPVMAGPLQKYLWSTASSYDYLLGEYEDPATLKLFISWLKPDSVFYDVGSNVGFHSLTANKVIESGKIYAFEPMPSVRQVFEKHISLNQKFMITNNITILPFAISNNEKQVEFSNDRVHRDGNTYIKESYIYSGTENKITVQCQSIDGLIKQGYDKPDIIKIDVEGAEFDVLTGAKNTLQQYRPNILLATHNCHLPGVQDRCVQFLKDLGYHLQHTGKHNKNMDGLDDYIAVHKSKL
ncbi:MAG: FkbM family methyltransferase [Chitinophagaceae bacterium]|nr:FkbM family methyltransferase [Chitinophagaceae bacterium]MBK8785176.1 FkbM family methyltransferase [Chitinophagaceae bacterium]MBL0198965.1 FkbM family methyltransferase [Chitinophagaceae bacterium]